MKQKIKKWKKVFKISEGKYAESERKITKKYCFKQISTRKFYAGKHSVSVVVNGQVMNKRLFVTTE